MGDRSWRLEEAADKQEIRDVLMRYCRGIDRRDKALLRSVYHSDGHESHGPFEGAASDYVDFVLDHMKNTEVSLHMILNSLIEVRGDGARSEAYFYAIQKERGETHEDHIAGRYHDRFERREGKWRIARRVTTIDWSRRQPVHPSEYPALSHFPSARRDGEDVSFTAPFLKLD